MRFDSDFFGTINADPIDQQLVMDDKIQAIANVSVAQVSTQVPVCVYHGPSSRTVVIRVGNQAMNMRTDSSGYGCMSFLMPENPGKVSVRVVYAKKTSIFTYVYIPSFKFNYKGGRSPVFTLDSKYLPAHSNVTMWATSRATGESRSFVQFTPQDMKSFKMTGSVPLLLDTFDLSVSANGANHASAILDVVPTVVAGGLRK
jgi:hypothetical protein